MGRAAAGVALTTAEGCELQSLANRRTTAQARLELVAADGLQNCRG
jgi:hypothetical protein